MGDQDSNCPACGANRVNELHIQAIEATSLRSARRWILGIGFWYMASAMVVTQMLGEQAGRHVGWLLEIGAGMFAIHVGLWWWSKRHVMAATIAALALFLLVQVVNASADPSSLASGWLLKGLVLIALGRAIFAAREVQKLRASTHELPSLTAGARGQVPAAVALPPRAKDAHEGP
jgi:hypothetical protein